MKFRIGIEVGLERPPEGSVVKDESGIRIGVIKRYFHDERDALWADVDLDPGVEEPESNILWFTMEGGLETARQFKELLGIEEGS